MSGALVQGTRLMHGSVVLGLETRFTGSSLVLKSVMMDLGPVSMYPQSLGVNTGVDVSFQVRISPGYMPRRGIFGSYLDNSFLLRDWHPHHLSPSLASPVHHQH